MDVMPNRAPRCRPDGRVTFVDLENAMLMKNWLNLKNGKPENRFWSVGEGCPERVTGEIFSLSDVTEELVFMWLYSNQRSE